MKSQGEASSNIVTGLDHHVTNQCDDEYHSVILPLSKDSSLVVIETEVENMELKRWLLKHGQSRYFLFGEIYFFGHNITQILSTR